ncbi:TRK1 [Candida pseudojiufengensis]|uniref:TRK1 n=1 Tax=Candida pseudojiufengensis TaxID=497109 RepID=UPI0022252AF8|nr:TRK1 [Candida pseudojiufengensis]KAI5962331.1 TRK1 [Candida pseudojiufengensis]
MTNFRESYKKLKRSCFSFDFGLNARNFIHKVVSHVYPYAKIVLPNFRAVHYFYIITLVFLGSILMYPVKSIAYIDVLFFSSGASTQAGLNTVDVNNISLYQQILLYLITTLSTPIFIHGSLLFVRLYYFERHFDGIREKSKLDFKMRRSATISRQKSNPSHDATRVNTATNKGLGFYDKEEEIESPQSSTSTQQNAGHGAVQHYSEPSDEEEDEEDVDDQRQNQHNNVSNTKQQDHAIKFGALPHPRRKKSIDPEDMLRSINMMKQKQKSQENDNNQQHSNKSHRAEDESNPTGNSIQFVNISSPSRTRRSSHNINHQLQSPDMDDQQDDNDDDDVLVIKPPNETENSTSHDQIFTKKKNPSQQIQFAAESKRLPHWFHSPNGNGVKKHYRPWTSKLKKSFSNRRFSSYSSEGDDDTDGSIDSEHANTEDEDDGDDDDDYDERGDTDYEDLDNVLTDADNEEDDDDEEEDDDEEVDPISRSKKLSQTNQNSPNPNDQNESKPHGNKINFGDDPIRNKNRTKIPNRRRRRKRKFGIRKIKTPVLSRATTSSNREGSIRSVHSNEPDNNSMGGLSRTMSGNYLSWTPTVGRNSNFIKLTEEQKDELGGIEYRAVKLLIKIVVLYYLGFLLLPSIMFTIWVYCMPNYKNMLNDESIVPGWWAFFTAQSSFNDLGLTLTPDSMISFNQNAFIQIVSSFLIVIGNTGFPVFLRFIIWVMFITAKPLSLYKESLGFLLDHPRRCFTLLFPSVPTWWLFLILVVLNGFDLIIFCILDLKNATFDGIPTGYRVLNGLYQAFCTRTVGFSVMDLSELHAATQVSYLVMMYISVLPVAMTVRRTNVYEEQSLGVYANEKENEADENAPSNYVGAHLRNQLSYDLWYIVLGLFIICIAEGKKLQKQEFRFSVFAILFEIISAYGTVGMSLGYPDVNTSLSGKFNVVSKLVIIAMMIRGRHRGLPYAIDRAIMLPDADMRRHDRVQEQHALQRHNTIERTGTTLGRVATFANGGPMDGGENLIGRVLTNLGNLRDRRKSRTSSNDEGHNYFRSNHNNNNRENESGPNTEEGSDQSTHSNMPRYLVTTVSHV